MEIFYRDIKIIVTIMLAMALAGCAAQAPYFKLDASLQKDIRAFDGVQYVPLIKLCDKYGLDWKWDSFIKTATIESNGKRIILRPGSDRILVDGNEKRLDRPVLLNDGIMFVPSTFVKNNLSAIVKAPSFERVPEAVITKKFAIKTIVIDPGHGGKDIGARGRKIRLREKDLTLSISKRLKKILEEHGIRVIMTRDDDRYIPLSGRVEITNRSGADLFVSVHVNASRSRTLKGFECYYLSDATDDNARALAAFENASLNMDKGTVLEHSKSLDKTLWDMILSENKRESAELASHICGLVEDSLTVKNRGIRSARFYVLKGTRIPSVLVEMGYLSNRYEELNLQDTNFLNKITDAVAKGILAYKDKYERTEGFTRG